MAHPYRAESVLDGFPEGIDNTVISMQDLTPHNMFDASAYEAEDSNLYLLIDGAVSANGCYFRSWTRTSLSMDD
jgi:hypothetical protein